MRKIIIWGAGEDYLKRRQYLEYEIKKSNIQCVAICSKDHYANSIEGIQVYPSIAQVTEDYDYILVFSDKYYDEIRNEIKQCGIEKERILDSRVLETYGFDFTLLFDLIENPVTLVTPDCMGALIYSYYKLPFTSPFILTRIQPEEYIRLLENWNECISSELKLGVDSNPFLETYARGILGNGDSEVWLDLYHYKDFVSAYEAWERRKKRINKDRMLFICQINNENIRNRFLACHLPGKKIGFVTDPKMSDEKECFYLPRYTWRTINQPSKYGIKIGDYLRDMFQLSYSIDILRMLTSQGDFIREKL